MVSTVVLTGATGIGKTALLLHWAAQVPEDEIWTFVLRGQAQAPVDLPKRSHLIALAHDCACCSGQVVLKTHLTRTLRFRKPHRLFIEAALDEHLPKTLAWLSGPQWNGWLDPVRCMAIVPALPGQRYRETVPDDLALQCADAVIFDSPHADGGQRAAGTTDAIGAGDDDGALGPTATGGDLSAAAVAQRLLKARQTGGSAQWRLLYRRSADARSALPDWPVAANALENGQRSI